jgi:PKD repeat protein/N-acetyl-anhydromuramyl-L-alanine amidase AmpD
LYALIILFDEMKNTLLLILILLGGLNYTHSQNSYPFLTDFEAAYSANSEIPKGILEAIAYTQTKFTGLTGNESPSCLGIPQQYGVMGLTLDGKGYFNNNLSYIANLSSNTVDFLKSVPSASIMAFASSLQQLMNMNNVSSTDFVGIEKILRLLSEIPSDSNEVNQYALSSYTYQVLDFLRDEENQAIYNFPAHPIDLKTIYGGENLKILRSKRVSISSNLVQDAKGNTFVPQNKSLEYAPALWVATPSCNYSSRSGTAVSAVTIHTIQGTYAGAISWAQNCNSNVSYHYVVRSSDGQVTQMVYEADKGWHVGSENPYTIGIEHEGYVDNAAWYTTSMYNSSADLVRDITQSGYGINPLRTFQGPATVGLNLLGSCIRIKGHQHYPNQSHLDPGVNWDWEKFYQLLNDGPNLTTYTANTGTMYDSGGSAGNYVDDERELYLIQPSSALSITISFNQFALEQNWDYLYVYDGATLQDPLIGVYSGSSIPADITSTGGSILVEFRSDCATQDAGWEIAWTTAPGPVPGDIISPTTSVNVIGNWQTTNFQADFTDADNVGGSGVDKKFYQVIDFDGTEWRGNNNNGFFSDNFDIAVHADWMQEVGTWGINAGALEQSDELITNGNIWANLDQVNYQQWLYHFSMNINGTGSNKRGGFHFMCDDPTLPNRGNSYFVWLRSDDNEIQIYKTVNDVFQLEADVPYTINDGQWYDIKTMFDKSTGTIQLFIDNVMEASWIDTAAYLTGNSISIRSGDATILTENLKVYHNRGTTEMVSINTGNDVQYQNPDALTPSAKIKSISIDSALNVSAIAAEFANVDWTPPSSIASINDGTGVDIDNTTTSTQLSANWSSSVDPNSDLKRYWYAIGTSPLATDIVGWTDNWWSDTLTQTGLNLSVGTTYYTCVYAENGAGLFSDTICSDGQTVQVPTATPTADFVVANSYICSFESVQVQNSSLDAQSYQWTAPGAVPSASTVVNPTFTYSATGYYDITLVATGVGGTDTEVQTIYVSIDTIPAAAFSPDAFIVDISSAFVTFTNQSQNANGYTWNFDDGTITNDVSPWHEFTATGNYNVELIAINGLCPNDTTSVLIQVIDDLNIDEENFDSFEIYPNPAIDKLGISLNDKWKGTVTIQLTDVRGRVILEEEFEVQEEIWVELPSTIEEAIYFLRISDGEIAVSRKILVKAE